ncbi:Immunoglobulin [Cordylochernes scorpioides]|uniref:Immunoglobulin n=1 Tax=Cordylochernes scorpioides TaxID=51811 RepID=A0ABY6L8P7_9ARAC|nr:Immunoglobulin [Cordylochernes scorpioides]
MEHLKFLRLAVPGALKKGEPADLTCEYDLEGETLYSVKWYKNNVEILRYIPSDAPASPPLQVFDLVGVHINVSLHSNSIH